MPARHRFVDPTHNDAIVACSHKYRLQRRVAKLSGQWPEVLWRTIIECYISPLLLCAVVKGSFKHLQGSAVRYAWTRPERVGIYISSASIAYANQCYVRRLRNKVPNYCRERADEQPKRCIHSVIHHLVAPVVEAPACGWPEAYCPITPATTGFVWYDVCAEIVSYGFV